MSEHPNLTVVDHPLVRHKLSILRSVDTSIRLFRDLAEEITSLMAFAATLDLEEEPSEVETPLESMVGSRLTGKKPAIFPILRAGLGMVAGMLQVMPGARVGHVGLARNEETLQPEEYYFKAPPDLDQRAVIVVDPMLATGGSAVAALSGLKARGAKDLRLVCLVAAPEGVRALREAHPDVHVYAAALDRQLNDVGYIVPGLGDAGDRLMGTSG